MFADRSLCRSRPPPCQQAGIPPREGGVELQQLVCNLFPPSRGGMSHSDREGVCSDLYSDLCSDLSRKEVTIVKAHKHWGERGISEVRRY